MKEENLVTSGKIIKIEANGFYRVMVNNTSHTVLAKKAGKMRKFKISLAAGDGVTLELSPYSIELARITRRL